MNTLDEIQKKISALSSGFTAWSRLQVRERVKKIRKLRQIIADNSEKIAETISAECDRPFAESITQELLASLEVIKNYEKSVPPLLKPRRSRYFRPGFLCKKNVVYREPLGTVAVVTPFNFPFSLGIMSIAYLLICGNTVALKPSEHSRQVAPLIAQLLEEAGLSPGIVEVFFGGPETVEALIENGAVKKVFFFGSRQAGRAVAEAALKQFKPFVLELGGGTTAFVNHDADIDHATTGIAWSGFYSNGHSCVGTDRLFVHTEIQDRFLPVLKEKAAFFQGQNRIAVREGTYREQEARRFEELIDNAVNEGAHILCGGNITRRENGKYDLDNTIITGCETGMQVFREEIFGPIIAVKIVENMEQGAAEMENCYRSLGVSIWMRHKREAFGLANRLNVGMLWINDTSFGLPTLPWVGRGEAGWGMMFSKYSLHQVTQLKWVSYHPSFLKRQRPWWPPFSGFKIRAMLLLAKTFYKR